MGANLKNAIFEALRLKGAFFKVLSYIEIAHKRLFEAFLEKSN